LAINLLVGWGWFPSKGLVKAGAQNGRIFRIRFLGRL